ncbi:hypothetical protein [Levilactobacillus fuyuanensis]|uniref:DUF2357 domain-containing protein n=1 Tax=Levilactobacillus fuyuanensis TaxID=2486022 RepID=A0ABW4H3A3_9LACO|nr:hypothetical protein [Levilactobacillus fuyuanensis]
MRKRTAPLTEVKALKQTVLTFDQAITTGISTDMLLMLLIKQMKQGQVDTNGSYRNDYATSDLYLVPKWSARGNFQVAVKVEVKNHVLRLRTETFKKTLDKQGFGLVDGCFKWLPKSNGQPLFKVGGIKNHRNLTPFLSVEELDQFEKTKLGIMNDLITGLGEQFPEYFKMFPTPCEVPLAYYQRPKLSSTSQVWQVLGENQLHFFANYEQPDVLKMTQFLQAKTVQSSRFKELKISSTVGKQPVDGLNIQVVADLDDSHYICGSGKRVVQHLTLTNFSKLMLKDEKWDLLDDTAFQMMLYQLGIKREVMTAQLQIPSEVEISAASQFRYLMLDNLADKKSESLIRVTRLTVSATGKLSFEKGIFRESDVANTELLKTAHQIWASSTRRHSYLVGAIQSDTNLFIIYGTYLITVPDSAKLKAHLVAADGENRLSRSELITAAQATVTVDETGREQLVQKLRTLDQATLTVRQANTVLKLNWKTKLMQAFNNQFFEDTGIWLHIPVRQKRFDAYWAGTYGMGLLELQGRHYYFVGNHQLIKGKQARAIPLKQIEVLNSSRPKADIQAIFQAFESLLQVDFVRFNRYTVIPFPFKYIREYLDLEAHLAKEEASLNKHKTR